MFVFWYCHKRGKQVRLDRENEEGKASEAAEGKDDFDGSDFDATDSDNADDDNDIAEQIATAVKEDRYNDDEAAALKRKEDVLSKPEAAKAPLPDAEKGEKGAELEAEKSVGV